jgi:hypothetical protein
VTEIAIGTFIPEAFGVESQRRIAFQGALRWPDNNSMFRRLSCNKATSKE